jgi:CheY-like chemotaxis protein/HPt (histidine-containing phosphotransfer) domain-containing protein
MDEETPAEVIGDVTRLRQILVNLVGNAIKFTAKGEVLVDIKAKPLLAGTGTIPPSAVNPTNAPITPCWGFRFSVRDTGVGIPPERLHRLFRSFSQVDSSITRHYGGTGLGLAISKGLVELMGGKIWVESTEGQGSIFRFVLPLQSSVAAGEPILKKRHVQFAGLRLLLVEDNTAIRHVLAGLTKSWGLSVTEAGSSQQVFERLAKGESFDLGLVDMQMPGDMDGLALAKEIRNFAQAKSLPLLLMTSVGERNEYSAAVKSLTKPIKPAQLQSSLLNLISGDKPAVKRPAPAPKFNSSTAQRLPLRLLLADDNVINQKVALRLLQQLGYRADIVKNGLEVLQAIEAQPYDIIFMDVQMPEMDGLEASRQIRKRQQAPSPHPHFKRPLTIIAMTANAMQGDREKCFEAGMNDYIPKPVRPEMLHAAIERFGALATFSVDEPAAENSSGAVGTEVKIGEGVQTRPAAPSVDLERLMEFAGGDTANFNELVDLYLTQTKQQLAKISEAIRQGDTAEAARLAHSCAGASATCGMMAMVPILRQLDQCSQAGDLAPLPELHQAANDEFERVRKFFELRAKSPLPHPSNGL